MMDQRKHQGVVGAVYSLAETVPGDRVRRLREYAVDQMERGYPREALLEDFEEVRSSLEDQDRDPEEDDVVTVMDALTGYCSPAARL